MSNKDLNAIEKYAHVGRAVTAVFRRSVKLALGIPPPAEDFNRLYACREGEILNIKCVFFISAVQCGNGKWGVGGKTVPTAEMVDLLSKYHNMGNIDISGHIITKVKEHKSRNTDMVAGETKEGLNSGPL